MDILVLENFVLFKEEQLETTLKDKEKYLPSYQLDKLENMRVTKQKPTNSEIRALSIRLILGLPIVGFIWTFIIKQLGEKGNWNWNILLSFVTLACLLGLGSILSSKFGNFIYQLWHSLTKIIDKMIIWSFLPLFYYLIFSPYSVILRTFGKSKFVRKSNCQKSYWLNVEKPKQKKRYLQQF